MFVHWVGGARRAPSCVGCFDADVASGDRVFVTQTHMGGLDFIPPQPDRSVDAEAGLAWDLTGGANACVCMIHTREHLNESNLPRPVADSISRQRSRHGRRLWT